MADTPPKIKVGAFEVAFLADGLWRNDGGCMFGVVPRELWKSNHPPDDRNRIRLNLTCPLIMKGADAVLVDTGIGNRLSDVERKIFDHGDGWLPNHLRALGMEAGDVTHLIVSHLHFDHCGGIVRRRDSGTLEAAFPRARIFIQRGELDLADHQAALVTDGGECFMHLADIVPTRSHIRGPWNQAYDLDALRTMEQKAHYLGLAAQERWWLSFAHDDTVFAAMVKNERGRMVIGDTIPVSERLFR